MQPGLALAANRSIQVRTHLRETPIAAAMWAWGQPARCRSTISMPAVDSGAGITVGHENLRVDVGLRQATPHSEAHLVNASGSVVTTRRVAAHRSA